MSLSPPRPTDTYHPVLTQGQPADFLHQLLGQTALQGAVYIVIPLNFSVGFQMERREALKLTKEKS